MKLTKKLRYLFSLAALLICMCMSSVAVFADTLDYSDYLTEATTSADSLETYAGGKISLADAKSLVESYVSLVQQLSVMSESEIAYIEESYASNVQTAAIVKAYKDGVDTEKYGKFVSAKGDVKVVETKEEDGTDAVDVTVTLAFEKKDYVLTLHVDCFDTLGTVVDTVSIKSADEGNESMKDRMLDAAGNTVMGMGTVFIVLIFISLLISAFKFIPQIMDKLSGKAPAMDDVPVVEEKEDVAVAVNDDSELIAVIAAAIAASEQTSTDSFVVRSIRRR